MVNDNCVICVRDAQTAQPCNSCNFSQPSTFQRNFKTFRTD